MRTPTKHKVQRNRCSYCGHRWNMHGPKGCKVVTPNPEDHLLSKECECGH